jgi:UDP-3-O-[3-hydroxymyristoyl] glucosamine N-acyltransferase
MAAETSFMQFTVAEIAEQLQAKVHGDAGVVLTGVASADQARPGDLTFAEDAAYLEKALASAAAAVLTRETHSGRGKVVIEVANPRTALTKVLSLFHPPAFFAPGIHPTAWVASSAQVDPSVHLGPYCVVAERVSIGPNSVLEGGVHVGADCVLGEEVHLFPNVVLYAKTEVGNRVRIHAGTVIGADGFGYVFDQGVYVKIPQVGNVLIQDDVEIGANVTIDRGALGSTVIGRGSKIDNLVQIGHNVVVGEHCVLVAQVGISGSTRLGNFVTLAGQVGLADHLEVGNRVRVGAKAGVMHNIPEGEVWLGIPAREGRQAKRQMVALQHLPELVRRVSKLERSFQERSDPEAGHPTEPG